MKTPEKIIINGNSGFFAIGEAYKDQLIITPESIEYELTTRPQSGSAPKKWKFTSNSMPFRTLYQTLASRAIAICETEQELMALDGPEVELSVAFSDSSTLSKEISLYVPGIETLVMLIGFMIPAIEEPPKSLEVLEENCDENAEDDEEEDFDE